MVACTDALLACSMLPCTIMSKVEPWHLHAVLVPQARTDTAAVPHVSRLLLRSESAGAAACALVTQRSRLPIQHTLVLPLQHVHLVQLRERLGTLSDTRLHISHSELLQHIVDR